MTLLKQVKNKYNTLYARVAKALQTGKFATYTAAQQQAVYNRLRRYENRLKHFGVAVTSAAALFFLPMQAAGQVVPVGNEFLVNTYTANNQNAPAIAMDSDGDFVIAWSSYGQDGNSWGIYAQRYNSTGAAQGGEFLVNTHTAGSQYNPSVAMDSDGDFVIAWQSYGQDGSGFGVYAQRYNSNGVAQGSEFQVNTYISWDQSFPSIAMDSDGDFVIAWQSLRQDGSDYGIYAQRYDKDGTTQDNEFLVNTSTIGIQVESSVGVNDNGDFVITWRSSGIGSGIYARKYNNGVAQSNEFFVNESMIGASRYPRVAVDNDGDFIITWAGSDENFYGVYAQRYNNNCVEKGDDFLVNTTTLSLQHRPSIGIDDDGDFVIAWQSLLQDGSDYGIYAKQYKNNSNGIIEGGEFLVNTTTFHRQSFPAVRMNNDGDFVIAWQSNEQDGSGYGIYAQRYSIITPTTPDLTAATKILLYPNPVSEVVVIENAVGTATVFNALGQALQQFNITDNKHFFNTNGLTSGVYTLQIRDANGTVAVKQFIK